MAADRAAPSHDADSDFSRPLGVLRWCRFAPAVALGCVLVGYLIKRYRVDLRFPVPWPDEGSFLWQALAFRDHFSLFAPEVNPEREALWIPPGFMVLEGLVFKVVPFSLSASRTLSALFVCGAVLGIRACIRRFETRVLFPVVTAFCLFCPIVSMAGNVARMEGLELLVLSLAFFLLERRRGAALGLLLVAPLVHPNGLFGVAVGLPCYLVRARGGRGNMQRADLVVIGAALLGWAFYGFHVSQHWAYFLRDMDAQLRFKQYVSAADGGMVGRITEPVVWGAALGLFAAFVAAWRARLQLGALGAFAAALLVQTVTAAGWLYEVYPAFAVLVTSVVVADVAFSMLATSRASSRGRIGGAVAAAIVLVAADAAAFRHDAFLERSLYRATVLRKSLRPAYVTDADRAAVERYLASIVPSAGAPLAVQFLPDAEALLYEKLRTPTFHYVQQTFYEHRYDVLLVHDSVWFPPFVRNLELIKLLYVKGGDYDTQLIYERDGTERYTAYRWRGTGGTAH